MKTYQTCETCEAYRKDNTTQSLMAAKSCHSCKGTGIRITDESYRCNRCGKSTLICGGLHGLNFAKVGGGYYSIALVDLNNYEFSICESCLRYMFENEFIIPPTITSTMYVDDEDLWERDKEIVNERRAEKRAACVFIQHQGAILAVARRDDPNAWGLPGGKCDVFEDKEDAARREFLEEIGTEVEISHPAYTGPCGEYDVTTFYGKCDISKIKKGDAGRVALVGWTHILNGPFGDYNQRLKNIVDEKI